MPGSVNDQWTAKHPRNERRKFLPSKKSPGPSTEIASGKRARAVTGSVERSDLDGAHFGRRRDDRITQLRPLRSNSGRPPPNPNSKVRLPVPRPNIPTSLFFVGYSPINPSH